MRITLAKALWGRLCTFYKITEKIKEERTESVFRYFTSGVWSAPTKATIGRVRKCVEDICADRDRYVENPLELKGVLDKLLESQDVRDVFLRRVDENGREAVFNKVLSYLKPDDDGIKAEVLKKILSSEYHMQIGNLNSEEARSSIVLEIHGNKDFEIEIQDDEPLSEKLNHILDILNRICDGNLAFTEDGYAYSSAGLDKPLALSNVSTGLKTLFWMNRRFTCTRSGSFCLLSSLCWFRRNSESMFC